ncbi:MAG TPA: hypothetical protein VI306_07400 [Pyrinomonadaceae bacterium]
MKNSAKLNYVIIAIGFPAITAMYWFAADPPSPWIFAVTGAGALFSIGVTIYRKRKGTLT